MIARAIVAVVLLWNAALSVVPAHVERESPTRGRGDAIVRGGKLLRDSRPWIPHGYYQIAFEVAPANFARVDHPFWRNAYEHFDPREYRFMRDAGADSVRLQIAQIAADPKSKAFDPVFLEKALDAVRAARSAGLTVIVSIQAESHVPGETPIDLPDDATRRVWKRIAPQFGEDRGVLFELLNEPQPPPTPENWKRWADAMTKTIRTVRETGAQNVVIADGLGVGQVLGGAPLLDDAQVVYASHPYALHPMGQARETWDKKFGNFSRRAPVIITEWFSGSYYCDANTPESTVEFLQYLNEHGIGLEVGVWDWTSGGFGSARWDFPNPKPSSFAGLQCHQKGYGLGKVIDSWYKTGVPPNVPE